MRFCNGCCKVFTAQIYYVDKATHQHAFCSDCFNNQPEKQAERELYQTKEVNMITAQEWLNQKFPTPESKTQVKTLELTSHSGSDSTAGTILSFHSLDLTGSLDLSDFINLESLTIRKQNNLTELKGLEKLFSLVHLDLINNQQLKFSTFLDAWKQEIQNLKAQIQEYENQETSSQTSQESTYSNLSTTIAQKKQELQAAVTGNKKSTKYLRKEIELLEKIQSLENQISQLQAQEATYQQQIRHKDEQIQAKQNQITQLQSQTQQNQRKIN